VQNKPDALSAISQQYFSLRTNQPPATSQQYFSLRTNQHQPSATGKTNTLFTFVMFWILMIHPGHPRPGRSQLSNAPPAAGAGARALRYLTPLPPHRTAPKLAWHPVIVHAPNRSLIRISSRPLTRAVRPSPGLARRPPAAQPTGKNSGDAVRAPTAFEHKRKRPLQFQMTRDGSSCSLTDGRDAPKEKAVLPKKETQKQGRNKRPKPFLFGTGSREKANSGTLRWSNLSDMSTHLTFWDSISHVGPNGLWVNFVSSSVTFLSSTGVSSVLCS
jgi:hypothetical protein